MNTIMRVVASHCIGELFLVETWGTFDGKSACITVTGQGCKYETEEFPYTFQEYMNRSVECTGFIIDKLSAAMADARQVVNNIEQNQQRVNNALSTTSPPA